MIRAGRRSKWRFTSSRIRSSEIFPVPNESTDRDSGSAIPIPYATSSSNRSARPAATTFFATQRAAYAAERSTLDGSLPLNAPPPWRAIPPYVSTMILRPVSPASPIGPPTTNRPVGLTCMIGSTGRSASGITGRITWPTMSSRMRSSVPGSCCDETTTVRTRTGTPRSYSTVTCVLPSGRR